MEPAPGYATTAMPPTAVVSGVVVGSPPNVAVCSQVAPQQTPGVVVSMPSRWPSEFCCWDGCGCCKDCGLCCYATCCPYCAYADVTSAIQEPSCCCPVGFCNSLLCALSMGLASYAIQVGLNLIGMCCLSQFANLVPCITCQARVALGRKYNLPTGACGAPCCAHYWCLTCALYQEAVYVKHILKKDMTCCCYVCCCKGLTPGKFPGVFQPTGGAPTAADDHLHVLAERGKTTALPFDIVTERLVVTAQPK